MRRLMMWGNWRAPGLNTTTQIGEEDLAIRGRAVHQDVGGLEIGVHKALLVDATPRHKDPINSRQPWRDKPPGSSRMYRSKVVSYFGNTRKDWRRRSSNAGWKRSDLPSMRRASP